MDFRSPRPTVRDLYAELLGRPDATVDDSFVSLRRGLAVVRGGLGPAGRPARRPAARVGRAERPGAGVRIRRPGRQTRTSHVATAAGRDVARAACGRDRARRRHARQPAHGDGRRAHPARGHRLPPGALPAHRPQPGRPVPWSAALRAQRRAPVGTVDRCGGGRHRHVRRVHGAVPELPARVVLLGPSGGSSGSSKPRCGRRWDWPPSRPCPSSTGSNDDVRSRRPASSSR